MGEAIPNADFPQPEKDYSGELQQLRAHLAQLEQRILSREQVAQIAKGAIKLQSGQNCRVSGGSGEWTIDFQMPNATVVITGGCSGSTITLQGQIQWG